MKTIKSFPWYRIFVALPVILLLLPLAVVALAFMQDDVLHWNEGRDIRRKNRKDNAK